VSLTCHNTEHKITDTKLLSIYAGTQQNRKERNREKYTNSYRSIS